MDGNASALEREVLRWPSVSKEPGRFGATSFRYGKREIGHLHHDRIADLPVTAEMRERVLSEGRARPHRAGVKGYVGHPLENEAGVAAVLEILNQNYDRAKAARRASQTTEEQR